MFFFVLISALKCFTNSIYREQNYGTIMTTLAHEISHAFDYFGSFDALLMTFCIKITFYVYRIKKKQQALI